MQRRESKKAVDKRGTRINKKGGIVRPTVIGFVKPKSIGGIHKKVGVADTSVKNIPKGGGISDHEKAASRALAESFCRLMESWGYSIVDETPKNPGPWIKCRKCKEKIRSNHRHDFRRCKCGAIAIDGGSDYTRICGATGSWENI